MTQYNKKCRKTLSFYITMSCYKQLLSIEKLNMITTLALTITSNHKCFPAMAARRILDLSFVTVRTYHARQREIGTGSFLRHKTRK